VDPIPRNRLHLIGLVALSSLVIASWFLRANLSLPNRVESIAKQTAFGWSRQATESVGSIRFGLPSTHSIPKLHLAACLSASGEFRCSSPDYSVTRSVSFEVAHSNAELALNTGKTG